MRDDDSLRLRFAQPVIAALRQALPHAQAHILAVEIGNLLCHQTVRGVRQPGYTAEHLRDVQRACHVPQVVARLHGGTCNRSPGGQQHDFFG